MQIKDTALHADARMTRRGVSPPTPLNGLGRDRASRWLNAVAGLSGSQRRSGDRAVAGRRAPSVAGVPVCRSWCDSVW